ncbi:hypothetical protein MVES1_001453 [Malassezia vespertilionis]|uniref:Uncharacterized protein n=1 Tax=Malassezia vespertilionis TaxID=2020962 RepID=A0A2N1JF22_9BASI|nr:uncharacterized protein MVES1_001453 [Malassezia vespertilionis]PKI85153.1 hypothetical protein MVES_001369 [Malassezia vespertilionis]WFD06112.1 hypothetical protein MVES1_001453 [Malassezia vespertilionis]
MLRLQIPSPHVHDLSCVNIWDPLMTFYLEFPLLAIKDKFESMEEALTRNDGLQCFAKKGHHLQLRDIRTGDAIHRRVLPLRTTSDPAAVKKVDYRGEPCINKVHFVVPAQYMFEQDESEAPVNVEEWFNFACNDSLAQLATMRKSTLFR